MANRDIGNRDMNERNVNTGNVGTQGGVGGRGNVGGQGNVAGGGMGAQQQEPWNRFRTGIRQRYTDLNERDIDQYRGRRREDLVGFIGERTGRNRQDIDRDVDTLARDTGYRFG